MTQTALPMTMAEYAQQNGGPLAIPLIQRSQYLAQALDQLSKAGPSIRTRTSLWSNLAANALLQFERNRNDKQLGDAANTGRLSLLNAAEVPGEIDAPTAAPQAQGGGILGGLAHLLHLNGPDPGQAAPAGPAQLPQNGGGPVAVAPPVGAGAGPTATLPLAPASTGAAAPQGLAAMIAAAQPPAGPSGPAPSPSAALAMSATAPGLSAAPASPGAATASGAPAAPTGLLAGLHSSLLGNGQNGQPPPPGIQGAILAQESGNRSNIGASVDGAVGPGQIMPATFAQYAKPGERIDNPADNRAVSARILQDYNQRYGGDPARVAVAYFSGPGNVAPPGSATPYIHDYRDGNGKHVSSYVADIAARSGAPMLGSQPYEVASNGPTPPPPAGPGGPAMSSNGFGVPPPAPGGPAMGGAQAASVTAGTSHGDGQRGGDQIGPNSTASVAVFPHAPNGPGAPPTAAQGGQGGAGGGGGGNGFQAQPVPIQQWQIDHLNKLKLAAAKDPRFDAPFAAFKSQLQAQANTPEELQLTRPNDAGQVEVYGKSTGRLYGVQSPGGMFIAAGPKMVSDGQGGFSGVPSTMSGQLSGQDTTQAGYRPGSVVERNSATGQSTVTQSPFDLEGSARSFMGGENYTTLAKTARAINSMQRILANATANNGVADMGSFDNALQTETGLSAKVGNAKLLADSFDLPTALGNYLQKLGGPGSLTPQVLAQLLNATRSYYEGQMPITKRELTDASARAKRESAGAYDDIGVTLPQIDPLPSIPWMGTQNPASPSSEARPNPSSSPAPGAQVTSAPIRLDPRNPDASFQQLPPGATYIGPDGRVRRK